MLKIKQTAEAHTLFTVEPRKEHYCIKKHLEELKTTKKEEEKTHRNEVLLYVPEPKLKRSFKKRNNDIDRTGIDSHSILA